MVDIDKLLRGPQPHPFKEKFKKFRVSHAKLAAYLGYSQQMVSKWLSGYKPIPPEIEKTMVRIIAELKKMNDKKR